MEFYILSSIDCPPLKSFYISLLLRTHPINCRFFRVFFKQQYCLVLAQSLPRKQCMLVPVYTHADPRCLPSTSCRLLNPLNAVRADLTLSTGRSTHDRYLTIKMILIITRSVRDPCGSCDLWIPLLFLGCFRRSYAPYGRH